MIASAISVLTDLTLIHVKPPFNYGILDGLLMLLNQMLNQGEQMIADQILESHLWDYLWTRVLQSLKPNESDEEETLEQPDWTFLSPTGFISVLSLVSRMLTLSTHNCVALFVKDDSTMFDSLSYMLSERFFDSLKVFYTTHPNNRQSLNQSTSTTHLDDEDSVEYLTNEFILTICQILCFPFAIEPNEHLITRMYTIVKDFNLFTKVCTACVLNAGHLVCDIPIGLIARLVLTDEDLVQLLIEQLNNNQELANFFKHLIYNPATSDSLMADLLAIISHLSRKSEDSIQTVVKILRSPEDEDKFKVLTKYLTS